MRTRRGERDDSRPERPETDRTLNGESNNEHLEPGVIALGVAYFTLLLALIVWLA